MPDFLVPFGPFHMVMLHLPIGALAAIWFLEILMENDGYKHKSSAIGLLHLFLVLTSGLTIVLGLAYGELGNYGDEIAAHERWGYIFGGGVLLSYLLYWIHRLLGEPSTRVIYLLVLFATTIIMTIAGHQGAELIHGKAFLSKPFKTEKRRTPKTNPTEVIQAQPTPAPTPVSAPTPDPDPDPDPDPATNVVTPRTTTNEQSVNLSEEVEVSTMESAAPMMDEMTQEGMMGAMTPLATAPPKSKADPRVALFESSQAVFKRHCINCHGATKQKGDYRLDNKHSINLAGKSDLAAIVPGDAEDSELMYRMLLPRDDDDVMPPEEKEPVSAENIEIVRQWIEAGAYWPDESELSSAPGEYIQVGDANTDALIEQINATGVKAEYNAWGDESIRIDLGVVEPGQLNKAISQLSNFGSKLTWLDCSGLELSDGFWKAVQKLKHLERLHLDATNVTDEQLIALSQLPKLSYLNLYNTQISDKGLSALQDFPALEKVFLSQTKVTAKGLTALKQAKPKLEVIHQP